MSASPLPYVVFGVTGRTGAAAATALLRAGQPVRVVLRDVAQGRAWAERGAQVAVADLTDLAALTRALAHAQGAYVLSPQHYGREDLFELADLIADVLARAAVAAQVPRLVALSSVGADRDNGTGWIGMNRMLEQRLGHTGIPTTFLRAAYFMENWMPMVQQAVASGVLPSFLAPPERAIPMVATADVGSAASALLQQQWSGRRVMTLAGPRDYAPNDVAAAVSRACGRPVEVAVVEEARWPEALAGAGWSRSALAGFTDMTRALNNAHIDMRSDPDALEWAGTTALDQLVGSLADCGAGR